MNVFNYSITLNHNGSDVVVDDIWLAENEGDWDDATTLAIEMLRDEGLTGPICYVSHEKSAGQ